MHDMGTLAIIAAVGFGAAALGGMVGVGGGFVMVPFLCYYWPEASPAAVTFVSLVMIVCNAVSGSIAFAAQKRIDYRSGMVFAVATVVPAVAGVYVVRHVDMTVFKPLFGGMLVCAACVVARRAFRRHVHPVSHGTARPGMTQRAFTDALGVAHCYEFRMWRGVVGSIVAGFCSSFFGIGGGMVHVPVLTQLLHWPAHIATATSSFVLAISASTGVLAHVLADSSPPLPQALAAGAGALCGGYVAAQCARRVSSRTLLIVFALVQFVLGARMALAVFAK